MIHSSIETISFRTNEIGDLGMIALAAVLKINTSIHSVDMDFNLVGNDGMARLAEAFTVNSSLSHLRVCFNKIYGGQHIANFISTVKTNPALLSIHACGNSFSVHDLSRIVDAHAQACASLCHVMSSWMF